MELMIQPTLRRHLISHRLRGFSPHESSLSALHAALASDAELLEVDTRVSADRRILVFHDARLEHQTTSRGLVREYSVSSSGPPPFRDAPAEAVATLEEFIECFSAGRENQQLWIDIKDAGFEEEHWRILDRYGVAGHVHIVSWLPEVLIRFHEIAPAVPLCFSHVAITRWTWAFHFALRSGQLLSRLIPRRRGRESLFAFGNSRLFLNDYNRTAPAADLSATFWGHDEVHFLDDLPCGRLGTALRVSRGAVGTFTRLVTPAYVRAAHTEGLGVFLFSIDEPSAACRVLETCGPDVIFTNRADFF